MVTPDVNILVQAFRPEMPEHVRCRNWLKRQIKEGSLALSPLALSGMVRVVTRAYLDTHNLPADRAACATL